MGKVINLMDALRASLEAREIADKRAQLRADLEAIEFVVRLTRGDAEHARRVIWRLCKLFNLAGVDPNAPPEA